MSYLAHPTCLALLFIASLGFLSLQFQMLALDGIKRHARANANATVAASTSSLTNKLNAMALQSSQQYANDFNTAVATYQQHIDTTLFGPWINTTAGVLNSTLVEFYGGIEQGACCIISDPEACLVNSLRTLMLIVLNTTFGRTVLYGPFNTFLYCILGSKIDNLQTAMKWVSQHAHITLPTLPPDVLLLSKDHMNEMASPIVAAAMGGGGDQESTLR